MHRTALYNAPNQQVVEASTREGASVVDKWFIGCNASHVVCEGTSMTRYLGHSENLVTVRTSPFHCNQVPT